MAAFRHVCLILVGLFMLAVGAAAFAPKPALAVQARYGCFQVVGASTLNIRQRAYSKSPVVAVARRDQILGKWRRFCAIRGFWCPVETGDGVRGWADKRFLSKLSCG